MSHQNPKTLSKWAEPDPELDRCARSVFAAALEVHRVLGPGFIESAYEEALSRELDAQGIPFERQVSVPIHYKGAAIAQARLDLLVEKRLIVELKAIESLLPIHTAQLVSYLRATTMPLGLLINFNVRLLRDGVKRVIRSG